MYMFTYFSKKLTFKNPYVILFQRVYILPLRNENVNRNRKELLRECLYPTFKEWKHLNYFIFQMFSEKCLYPTFKEWKQLKMKARLIIHKMFISYL